MSVDFKNTPITCKCIKTTDWMSGEPVVPAVDMAELERSSMVDSDRLNWLAINGVIPVDSVTGLVGGNDQKVVPATRANIDAARYNYPIKN